MFVFQPENLINIKQGKRTLGAYELGQEKKPPSHWSHQMQWLSMPRNQWPLACSLLYVQSYTRLSCQYQYSWRVP